jgi:hypothetical protein
MCLLLDPKSEKEIAYAQFPQVFYDGLKDDPYGNQFVVLFEEFKDPFMVEQDAFTDGKLSIVYHQIM